MVSVREIIDRANVGRATFHAHYENKEDLPESGFDGLFATLRERQREARSRAGSADEKLFAFSQHLLAHANEHRDVFPAIVSKRGGALIQQLLHRLLVKVVREDVKAMTPQGALGPEEAVVQFIAGGLFGLIMWWLGGDRRLTVEDMDGLFRQLAIPAMRAVA